MAHTILVRLDVDDEYADIPPDITAMDYLEGSKAHGWEVVTERVFTESEVRVMLDDIMGDDWRSISNPKTVAVSISRIVGIANTHGIVFDPA